MKNCLIVGKPNVGKTLFLVNFSEYLGLRLLEVSIQSADGTVSSVRVTPAEGRRDLVNPFPHKTTYLQSVAVILPRGKTRRSLLLVDTVGLPDGIHPDAAIRRAMVDTIRRIREARLVLHVMDVAKAAHDGAPEGPGDVDVQLARYLALRADYAILANKMDLPRARKGLFRITRLFPRYHIIPISALERRGFREVKAFVWRHL